MDRGVAKRKAVGQSLDRAQRKHRQTPSMELFLDLLGLAVMEEAQQPGLGEKTEGEGTLRRGQREGRDDRPSVVRAPSSDLENLPQSLGREDLVGSRVANRQRSLTPRALRGPGFVPERFEGSPVTRHAERDGEGGGC
jgi:hypothetical protein